MKKTAEDKRARLSALLRAHQAELSASPLFDEAMEAVAREEIQKLVDFKIEEINRQLNDLINDVFHL